MFNFKAKREFMCIWQTFHLNKSSLNLKLEFTIKKRLLWSETKNIQMLNINHHEEWKVN